MQIMVSKVRALLEKKSIQYTLMSAIASGINFITLIIFGRVFTVDDYGIITTLQAFVANVAIFMTPLQIIICKTVAEGGQDQGRKINSIINIFMIINAIELLIFINTSVIFSRYLHFTDWIEYAIFVVLIFANNCYIAILGISQGKQDFFLLGQVGIALYGTKMIVAVALRLTGMGPCAVIIGFASAEIICILIVIRKIKSIISFQINQFKLSLDKSVIKNYLWTFILYIVVSLYMNNGDLLIANLYCTQQEMGLYSVAINLAKISVFLIAAPIATILLPKVAQKGEDVDGQRKIVFSALRLTFVISALYGLCFYIFGKELIIFLYGREYELSAEYILPCVFFSTVLGLFWVFYQYASATELLKSFTVVTVILGVAAVLGILQSKCRIEVIPLVMSFAMALSMLIILIINLKKNSANARSFAFYKDKG